MRLAVLVGAIILLGQISAFASETPAPTVSPIARTHETITGQRIVVPSRPDVVVSVATFPPGSRIGEHRHPFPHLVYVMSGVLSVTNTETGKSFEARAGNFVAEMQDTWHYGENKGQEPVKLLVIDEVPEGTKTNIVPKAKEGR
jgi:quercetin dioxygenase-like cupin family protein